MTLGVSDLQSDSDLDSIRNSCDVLDTLYNTPSMIIVFTSVHSVRVLWSGVAQVFNWEMIMMTLITRITRTTWMTKMIE